MKRKIAVFGNGWSNEYLRTVMSGIRKCAIENNVDIFLFMNYSASGGLDENLEVGESNIFALPDFGEFDGVILLSNTFHLQREFDYLQEQITSHKIPAISLEYELSGMDYLGTDNYSGMYELSMHLLKEHKVKNVLFVSGPEDNVESNCRRQALADAMEECGLTLGEDNVVCGNWNYYPSQEAVQRWLDVHTEMPDAIVCANDVMAMAICSLLEEKGIMVPEQVKVTGYDHLLAGVAYSPMIASVDRGSGDMGYHAVKHLLNRIEGKTVLKHRIVSSKAAVGESCGCQADEEAGKQGRLERRMNYFHMVDNVFFGGHLCDMAEVLSNVKAEEALHKDLGAFWEQEHKYEENNLYLCLNDDFFSSLQTDEPMKREGYTDYIDMICGLRDGKLLDRKRFETRLLVPDYDGESRYSHIYVFVPVYSKKECYGYVAFGNEVSMMYDYSLDVWIRHVQQNLERVRQNIKMAQMNNKLSMLSVTDALTGIYNRMGCETLAFPYLEGCHKEGKIGVLMFTDVNKMKIINDKYGHLQGDVALRTVAKVLGDTLPESWISLRYGGDEFLIVGECSGEEEVSALAEALLDRLRVESEKMGLPYTLKMGVGYALISPDEELNMDECLKRADESMYLMKREQHKEEL